MDLEKIKARADKIAKIYGENPRKETFNAIIYGPIKIGKSSLIKTCRAPILVHSFDPGGTIVLRDEIENGRVLANTSFENEDPFNPWVFKDWVDEMKTLDRDGFFDSLGTFVIDSTTTWIQCIMYHVIKLAVMNDKKKKRVLGGHPHENDWLPQMQHIENWMRIFVSLPCDCILLGHDNIPTDRDTGAVIGDKTLLITGKLDKRVPALFDEIYYMDRHNGKVKLQTLTKNGVQSGTRMGRGGRLEEYEEPNIKGILKKVGFPHEDKTLFKDM